MFRVATTDEIKRSLLDAIRACGAGWHTRVEIAQKMGKNALNAGDLAILELMTEAGQVEQAMQPTKRRHIMRVVYKIKD